MRALYLTTLLLLLGSSATQAATPEQFAFGRYLELPPGGALYRLTLPEEIYNTATRADLGDLRVFNGRGEEVPLILRIPPSGAAAAPPGQEVPLFPLTEAQEAQLAELQIHIDPQGGAQVAARPSSPGDAAITCYLIELSDELRKQPIAALSFELAGEDFAAPIAIGSGNDPTHFRTIGSGGLARLHHGDARLERNRIELPQPLQGERYLRIDWPTAARSAHIEAVWIHPPRPAELPKRQWTNAQVEPLTDGRSGYYFHNPGVLPLEAVLIRPAEINSVARVRVAAGSDMTQALGYQAAGLAYELEVDGQRLTSDPLAVHSSDRYWTIELLEGGFGSQLPTIELGWTPRQLLFAARGEGPFTLAWGSAGTTASTMELDPLLRERQGESLLLKEARLGDERPLGGRARLEPIHELPWRRIALWGLLIVGVFGLGVMAWQLAREAT